MSDKLRTSYTILSDKLWTPYTKLSDKLWPPYINFSDNRHEDFEVKVKNYETYNRSERKQFFASNNQFQIESLG